MSRPASRRGWRTLLLLGVVAGAAVVARHVAPMLLTAGARGLGGATVLIGLFVLSCLTSVPPASLVAMAAGAIFGLGVGFGVAAVGLLLGAVPPFLLARYGLRGWVRRWLHRWPRGDQVDAAVARGGWRAVALLRLSPVMPFGPMSYAFGLTAIPLGPYLVGSGAALPALAVYVSLGVAAGDLVAVGRGGRPATWVQASLLAVGVATLVATVVYLRRLLRQEPLAVAEGEGGAEAGEEVVAGGLHRGRQPVTEGEAGGDGGGEAAAGAVGGHGEARRG